MSRYISQTTVIGATPTVVSYPLDTGTSPQSVAYFFQTGGGSDAGAVVSANIYATLQPPETATQWSLIGAFAAATAVATAPRLPCAGLMFSVAVSGSVTPFYSWQILQLGR